jgi:hypothetical protein
MTRLMCQTTRTRKSLRVVGALCGLVALASALLLARGVPSAFATSSGPLDFGAPALIDSGAPYVDSDSLLSLACPSATLCVGVSGGLDEESDRQLDGPNRRVERRLASRVGVAPRRAPLDSSLGGVGCVHARTARPTASRMGRRRPGRASCSPRPPRAAAPESWTTATASPPDSLGPRPDLRRRQLEPPLPRHREQRSLGQRSAVRVCRPRRVVVRDTGPQPERERLRFHRGDGMRVNGAVSCRHLSRGRVHLARSDIGMVLDASRDRSLRAVQPVVPHSIFLPRSRNRQQRQW